MVLRPISPKSKFMLSQQMKSGDRMIEADVVQSATDRLHPVDTPSITFANYNNQSNNLYDHPSLVAMVHTISRNHPLRGPMVSISERDFELIQPSLTRYHVNRQHENPSMSDCYDSHQPRLALMYYYLGNFSQSTACIASRFGECSSTMLHKLWYTYSYIYKPTTTICYGIYIFLNSRHTGPFRLLPCVKHTTPSASTPLFITSSYTSRSTFQLLVLLASTYALSLSITSGTLFVNFIQSTIFLSLAGVDNNNYDTISSTVPNIRYAFDSLHASPFRLLAILEPTTSFISVLLCTTSSTSHLLAFLESPVPLFPPLSWTLFVIFFFSPVGTVTLLQLILSYVTTTFQSNRLKLLSHSTTFNVTNILRLRRLVTLLSYSSTPSATVQAIVTSIYKSNPSRIFFVIFFLSSVGAVDRDTDFHLIDQGKVGYLYHLQILLFNLQDASSSSLSSNNTSASSTL